MIFADQSSASITTEDIQAFIPGWPVHLYIVSVGVKPGVSETALKGSHHEIALAVNATERYTSKHWFPNTASPRHPVLAQYYQYYRRRDINYAANHLSSNHCAYDRFWPGRW